MLAYLNGRSAEEVQIDAIGHGLVTSVVRMKMVATVVLGQDGRRVTWVANRKVEIDQTIGVFRVTRPFVEGNPCLLPFRIIRSILHGVPFYDVVPRSKISGPLNCVSSATLVPRSLQPLYMHDGSQ